MDISRLIFTKETKKKIKDGLSSAQKGKIRWDNVKKAEESGRLSYAKNRYEVASLAGFTDEMKKTGYQWTSNMVRRGHLSEVVSGVGKNGKMEYEYHTVDEPDFFKEKARKKHYEVLEQTKKKAIKPTTDNKIKGLSPIEKGRRLYERLKRADETGELSKARHRSDVAILAGYTDDKKGYQWVSNMIYRKRLIENVFGFDDEGIPIARYSIGKESPKYVPRGKTNRQNKHIVISNMPVEKPKTEKPSAEDVDNVKLRFFNKEISIEVEAKNCEQAIKLITTILKGDENVKDESITC